MFIVLLIMQTVIGLITYAFTQDLSRVAASAFAVVLLLGFLGGIDEDYDFFAFLANGVAMLAAALLLTYGPQMDRGSLMAGILAAAIMVAILAFMAIAILMDIRDVKQP